MSVVAVIGAGFCGTMLARHLLTEPGAVERVILVERSGRTVGGVAYATSSTSHTLNVPAGRMSALPDDPEDFLRFLRLRDPALTGGSFVPRKLYGAYLRRSLEDAQSASPIQLLRVAGDVVDAAVSPGGVQLALGDGRRMDVDTVVLAVGNFPPSDPPGITEAITQSLHYARDPWAPDALEADRDKAVLLIGTGLTMCDVVLALQEVDHRGSLVALSRRGLLPQAHRVSPVAPPHLDPPAALAAWPDTALGMARGLRAEVRLAAAAGVDWREVVTSVRHDTPALWRRLDLEERRRFLRHLRPFWETHRHRASPDTALAIDSLVAAGALRVVAGSLTRCVLADDGVAAEISPRGGGAAEHLIVGKVINCTGPSTDLRAVRDPLIAALRDAGAIRPDALGLGLDTDDDGRALGSDGTPQPRLLVAGPLRKGGLWENTAVPELRDEVARLARLLAAETA